MTGTIETHHSLEAYFDELIRHALEAERLVLGEAPRSYLLKLMTDFSQREALYGSCKSGENGTPALVFLYEKAAFCPPAEQFNAYRHLGDIALFVSGLFSQHVERSLVGLSYYVRMGEAAYDRAAGLGNGIFREVLQQLAQHFAKLVDVMARVAEQTTLPISKDLAALYERWSATQSEHTHKRLAALGAVPILVKGAA